MTKDEGGQNSSAPVDDGHGDLTFRIIGACMAVHNDLGPRHREIVYQRALAHRFAEMQLPFEREVSLPVIDQLGNTLIVYKVDFRIGGRIWLEAKALYHSLTGDEIAQVIDYFAADSSRTCNVALLINFGRQRLEWKRLFPPKLLQSRPRKQWGRPAKPSR